MEEHSFVNYPDPHPNSIEKAIPKTLRNIIFPKPKLSLNGHEDVNARQIAGMAWCIYGFLYGINTLYYTDYIYRHYVVDRYGRKNLGLATFSTWGVANFVRVASHMVVWQIAGILWALTFTRIPVLWVVFKYYATFLVIFELGRVLTVIIMDICAYIMHKRENESTFEVYDYFKEQLGYGNRQLGVGKRNRFIKSWDYKLEMLNISAQFLAYPLFVFGVQNSWQLDYENDSHDHHKMGEPNTVYEENVHTDDSKIPYFHPTTDPNLDNDAEAEANEF